MQNKTLLYWILNSDKNPLYINASGNVEVGSGVFQSDGITPAYLKNSPTGWSETLVKYGRNVKYLSLFREFSIPLSFVEDSAKIIRWAQWNYGIEGVFYIAISKLDRTTFPDKYDQWYTGELDFSKFKQTFTGVDISIMEGGLSKLLKANEGTTYEVDIHNDPDKFSLYLDGLPFKNNVEWTVFGDQDIFGSDTYLGCGIISQEGTTQGVAVQDGTSNFLQTYPNELQIVSIVNKALPLTFTVNLKVNVKQNAFLTIWLQHRKKAGGIVNYNILSAAHTAGEQLNIVQSFTIAMDDGDKIYPILKTPFLSTGTNWYSVSGGSIKLDYQVTFTETLCECISWNTLAIRLTEKITKGKYGFKSNYLESLNSSQAITSGQAIRQYQSDAVIKTSISDFFKACQRWGLGLGIENETLIIEPHKYFFQNNTCIELGEVKNMEISIAEDLISNSIKVGYQNQTYDSVNGKDEINVTQQYTTPLTRVVREMDLICPYRADMYGIELTRLKLFQKDTTDNKADNDTFIINVEKGTNYNYYKGHFETSINTGSYYIIIPTDVFQLPIGKIVNFGGNSYTVVNTSYLVVGYTTIQVSEPVINTTFNTSIVINDSEVYHLYRPTYNSITGLLFPNQAFNIELSPKHSLLNNGNFLHSILDYQDAGKIAFQSGEKNSNLVRTLFGVVTSEKADITIYDLPAKLFLPYYAHFKTQVNIDLPKIMRATPYQKVSFLWNGIKIIGYLWDGGIAPATDDAQEWKLLLAPENNMNKLI